MAERWYSSVKGASETGTAFGSCSVEQLAAAAPPHSTARHASAASCRAKAKGGVMKATGAMKRGGIPAAVSPEACAAADRRLLQSQLQRQAGELHLNCFCWPVHSRSSAMNDDKE